MSRSASAAPRSPATVEKRANIGVCLPISEKIFALVKRVDVVRDREGAMCAPALRMHAALGDHLAVEMRQLLDQPDVLQQRRAARAGGHNVGVVSDRCAGGVGEERFFRHDGLLGWDEITVVGRRVPDLAPSPVPH